jgi:5-methyltetrahydropteroyltriglutamate--homocysteine methyltransferase
MHHLVAQKLDYDTIYWGSTMGPHHTDVPLWKIWKDVKLPEGKVIIPGVIDSTSNFVEHPELVAERIARYANVVGREHMLAGVDCGFGTFAGRIQMDSNIVWLKLQALTEGVRLASQEL